MNIQPWEIEEGGVIREKTFLERVFTDGFMKLSAASPGLIDLISAEYAALLETGIEYGGNWYKLTDDVRGLAQGIRVNIMLGLVTGAVTLVTREDGTGTFATVGEFEAFYLVALGRFQDLSTKAGTAKQGIRDATTVADALYAYTGWSA